MQGWVKLHREVQENAVWNSTTPEQFKIFMTILLMVNHSANSWEWQGEKFHVEPGQTITSLDSICRLAGKGVTPRKVRTALDKFEKWGILTNKSTKQGRLITLINWGKYQYTEEKATKELTDERQTDDKQLTANKNDLNETMNENYIPAESSSDEIKPKDIVTLYYRLYKENVGDEPLQNYKKDCSVLKKSGVMSQNVETVKKKLRVWFKTDDYAKEKNFPLPLFVSKYNEIPTKERSVLTSEDVEKKRIKKMKAAGITLSPGQLPEETDDEWKKRIRNTSPEEWKDWMIEWNKKYGELRGKFYSKTFMVCSKCNEDYFLEDGHKCK
jgi:hypothetical protein